MDMQGFRTDLQKLKTSRMQRMELQRARMDVQGFRTELQKSKTSRMQMQRGQAKPRAKQGSKGCFAGRYPPDEAVQPDKFGELQMYKDAYMVAATFFRSHGPQINACRQAKTAQTNYWSFVRNYLSTARIEMQIGTRAPITQDNLLQEAANRYIASGAGQHRTQARSIITFNTQKEER